MEEKELIPDEDFKMGDDVYKGTELLGKFICYSYSEYYKELMVEVLMDSGKDRESNQGGWFAKDVSKTPQKPNRWIPKDGVQYWYINKSFNCDSTIFLREEPEDMAKVLAGNYFTTQESCQQAAEAVRETIMKFHEQNQK